MRIGLFCASSNTMDAAYYDCAKQLGTYIGTNGHTLVYGGANCGLMEAAARAVIEAGGETIGVVPEILCMRNRVSQYISTTISTRDLNDRKDELIRNSDIIVVMPGSVGTLDEAFTVMAANTIGIHSKRLIIWNINGFWNELLAMLDALNGKKVVNKPMDELYTVVTTLDELTALLHN